MVHESGHGPNAYGADVFTCIAHFVLVYPCQVTPRFFPLSGIEPCEVPELEVRCSKLVMTVEVVKNTTSSNYRY